METQSVLHRLSCGDSENAISNAAKKYPKAGTHPAYRMTALPEVRESAQKRTEAAWNQAAPGIPFLLAKEREKREEGGIPLPDTG